jgi:NAD(P)-dependent dehydrogenase (short-subunit alcohol dehydrogenase family)
VHVHNQWLSWLGRAGGQVAGRTNALNLERRTISNSTPRVWLVTGASSGFGRAIVEAAVASGDVVVATARSVEAVRELAAVHPDQVDPVQLDVTDHTQISIVIADVMQRHGGIDVLVNNAGRTHVGAVEETTEAELRSLFEVHFFGPAALIRARAVLPHMRERRTGAIVQMSSMGGQLSFAGFSAYSATKFALERLSEALADEVCGFGIKVLIVEPGAFRTGLFNANTQSEEISIYADSVGQTRGMIQTGDGSQPGDPTKAAAAILRALASEHTPLRLPLGDDVFDLIDAHLNSVRAELTDWETVIRDTAFS